MKIKAAIANEPGAPLSMTELDLDEPRDNEILVRMVSSGVCHSDIVVRDRGSMPALPAVLGHEGAGVVERVGSAVHSLGPGDHVVLSFASCGRCAMCRSGHPAYCADFMPLNFSGRRPDGSAPLHQVGEPVGGHFFGQSSFANYAVSPERCAVKVSEDASLRDLGPLGCGIQTGAGGAQRTEGHARVFHNDFRERGRRLSCLARRRRGRLLDNRCCRQRQEASRSRGRARSHPDLPSSRPPGRRGDRRNRRRGGLLGRNHRRAIRGPVGDRDLEGWRRGSLHGAPQPGDGGLDVSALPPGRSVTYLVEGDAVPQEFIPKLLRLHAKGRFPFEKLLRHYDFQHINQAIEDSSSGATIKPVLTFDDVP